MPHTLRTVAVSILALALLGWFLRDANLADVWHRVASLSLWDMVVATSLLAPMMLHGAQQSPSVASPSAGAAFCAPSVRLASAMP